MPRRRTSRPPATLRPPWYRRSPILVVIVALAAGLAVVDRLGWLGTTGDDYQRYHNRVFLVTRVIDGDTLHIAARDGRSRFTKVRLLGVDCPELARDGRAAMHFGPEAAEFMREKVLDESVRLELDPFQPSRDDYGRLLAYAYLPGEDDSLNEQLVSTGHAYAYRRFDHIRKQRFVTLESRARRKGVGLWADLGPEQMPTWRRAISSSDGRRR